MHITRFPNTHRKGPCGSSHALHVQPPSWRSCSASARAPRTRDSWITSPTAFDVSFVVGGMCGDMDVRIDAAGGFKVLGRETGPGRLHRYTVVHHGYESFTNLTTGKAITSDFGYVVQD